MSLSSSFRAAQNSSLLSPKRCVTRCLPAPSAIGWMIGLLLTTQGFTSPQTLRADEPPIYRVEEDWELVVREPDPGIHSPQVTLFTCPFASGDGQYFQFQLNHAADAWFSGGGFQVAAVVNEDLVDRARSVVETPLSINGDVVQWTVVMAVIDGQFLYAVKDGHAGAWGNFGGPEYLVRMPAGTTQDLSGYSYQNSLGSLDVGFGANRVESLRLKRVRYYDTSGDVDEVLVNP